MPTTRDRTLLWWLGLASWCAAIFALSSLPDYEQMPLDLETWRGLSRFLLRKGCHVFEYAVLMALAQRCAAGTWKRAKQWHLLAPFLFSVFYAFTDEWHQTLVFGRTGTVRDVLIDSLGALLGAGFVYWRWREVSPSFRFLYAAEKTETQGP